jgi:hypothetical protein
VVNPEQSEGWIPICPYQVRHIRDSTANPPQFNQRDVKIQAAIEESKKDKFEDTLSAVIASEFVIGENTWRRKNYKE